MQKYRCLDHSFARRPDEGTTLSPPHNADASRTVVGSRWMPRFDGTRLFIGRPGLDLTARDPASWKTLWSRPVPEDEEGRPAEGLPLLAGEDADRLLVGGHAAFSVVDPTDGRERVRHGLEEVELFGAGVIGDRLYAGHFDGEAFGFAAIELESGDMAFRHPLDRPAGILTSDGRRILIVSPREVTAHATSDGGALWRFEPKAVGLDRAVGRAVSIEDLFVVADKSDHVVGLDADNGRERWRVAADTDVAADVDGTLWLMGDALTHVRASDGKVLQRVPLRPALAEHDIHAVTCLPVVSTTHVYVAGIHVVAAVRKDGGVVDWSYSPGARIAFDSGLAAMAGLLFVRTQDGRLHVLR